MNLARLGGMALAVVGLIVLLISRLRAYPLGLYLGIIVILVGFVIYVVGVFKVGKNSLKTGGVETAKNFKAEAKPTL